MVSEKPWKMEGVLRLAARVLLSVLFLSSIATLVIHFIQKPVPGHAFLFSVALAGAITMFVVAVVVLGRAWALDNVLRNLTTVLACFYAGFFLMLWAQHLGGGETHEVSNLTGRLIIGTASFQAAALLWIHLFLKEHHTRWTDAFGLRNDVGRALLLGALVGLIFLPIGGGLQALSQEVMEFFRVQPQEQEAVQMFRGSANLSTTITLGITAIILAPLAEELLFRGILYSAIKQAGFPQLALWLTAVLFGSIHHNLAAFVPLTVLALALVWLYEHTNNLLAAITAHSVFNTAQFIMLCFMEWGHHPPVQA